MQDQLEFENAKNGDTNAFESLIKKYEKLYYNIAYRMLGNAEDAQDVAQDGMIKIYRNLEKCDEASMFKSWSCKIVTNTAIDYIRSRKRKQTESLDATLKGEEGDFYKQIASDAETPEESLVKKELNGFILNAINELPDKYKMVLILRDLNGLSYDEISKITDTSLGTVKSRISRGRNILKETLAPKLELNNKKIV